MKIPTIAVYNAAGHKLIVNQFDREKYEMLGYSPEIPGKEEPDAREPSAEAAATVEPTAEKALRKRKKADE